MRRREFVLLAGGVAATWRPVARLEAALIGALLLGKRDGPNSLQLLADEVIE
jgi:hypothetical protein